MLKYLRFDIFELQETKLPVRLINTTNERKLVQHEINLLRLKGDIEDVSSELDNRSIIVFRTKFISLYFVVGRGGVVVKVRAHGRRAMSSRLVALKNHQVDRRCTLNLSKVKRPLVGVEARRGVTGQVVVRSYVSCELSVAPLSVFFLPFEFDAFLLGCDWKVEKHAVFIIFLGKLLP
ncbi:hypothetical protein TNCV_4869501 [Trichonephila clavipes]|nr:hypothetical protein TNCV_4869501 [Trichonephila clavipes]